MPPGRYCRGCGSGEDVARVIAATVEGGLDGGAFAGISGARIPVDGGFGLLHGRS
jgi:hypothetical protein